MWISQLTSELHYIDQSGNHRKIPRNTMQTVVGLVGSFSIKGKLIRWVDANQKLITAHTDVSHYNQHSNTSHSNAGYSNSPHMNHSNRPTHNNIPFSNIYTDSPHKDKKHTDKYERQCTSYNDDGRYGDYYNDSPHQNTPYNDSHANVTFNNEPAHSNGHNDSGSEWHNNTPQHTNHGNVPYSDAPLRL